MSSTRPIRERPPRVLDRRAWLRALARDKRVLDLGAADNRHVAGHQAEGLWLHADLAEVAESCVGIDLDPEAVAALRAEGWDLRVGDVEALDLDERFDLVVAGELIEHLPNPGLLLASAARHLPPSGRLAITTPNTFALHARPGLLGPLARTRGIHPEHVAWYCADTLRQLLTLQGWTVEEIGYCASPSTTRAKAAFRRAAYGLRPSWSETLFALARPPAGEASSAPPSSAESPSAPG